MVSSISLTTSNKDIEFPRKGICPVKGADQASDEGYNKSERIKLLQNKLLFFIFHVFNL
ncbi:hypothetical protein BACPLE_03839 [Phocaeicola plebeius DSM 17135]|uniref:Uncharacterized protein n=1 Tax=Phocaeicola plebeius (strain DSM 17135 / JCM 12973 / CCUG 54634 / M2) TaxID=484018 RepID=B5D484_PHOPM|nr:hypothetical protein BACPLE_03839 [Phocaeicola plebeius DSM 17135]